jgi:hypothetical protein
MVVDLVAAELDRVHERIAGRFARSEPRARVREYVSGLVAGLGRKNSQVPTARRHLVVLIARSTGPDLLRRPAARLGGFRSGDALSGTCDPPSLDGEHLRLDAVERRCAIERAQEVV